MDRLHPGLRAILGYPHRRTYHGPLGTYGISSPKHISVAHLRYKLGPLLTLENLQSVIWPFSLLLVVAMMLTSLCTEFYQFLLCQGIFLGFSCGLIFAPALTVVGHYFFKKRAMAMAYASTGSPIGGIIYPVVLTNLINNPRVGFAWAQRTCGFISLFLLLIAAAAIRPRPGMTRKSSLVIPGAFKKPEYSLQVAGLFLVVLGFWTPYFYLATYAEAHGMSSALASYLFAIINAGSFAGRILGGTFAQHAGQFNVTASACYSSAVLLFCWLAITSSAGLIVLSVLFGGTSGIIIALMMSTVAHCAPHPSQVRLSAPCLPFGPSLLTRYIPDRCICWPVNLCCGLRRSCWHTHNWSIDQQLQRVHWWHRLQCCCHDGRSRSLYLCSIRLCTGQVDRLDLGCERTGFGQNEN